MPNQLDVGWLVLDTDEAVIRGLSDPLRKNCLSFASAVHLRLKDPKHYRQSGNFPQISRRWVYNVPRSLKTDGVRPLGMLAFLDNAAKCYEALIGTIADLIESDGDESRNDPITVYLFASVHGGTGGAIANEIAYLIKQIGAELSLEINIELLATCGIPPYSSVNDLQTASALACLLEINYYFQSGGLHPPIQNIPESHAASEPPYRNVTLVFGGNYGDRQAWNLAIQQSVDYAWARANSELGPRMALNHESLRKAAAESLDRSWDDWLLTVATRPIQLKHDPIAVSTYICLQALQSWLRGTPNSENHSLISNEPDPKTAERIEYLLGDLFRSNKWTAQAWVRECMLIFVPPETTMDDSFHNAASNCAPVPRVSDVALPPDQKHILDQICQQLAIPTNHGWDAVTTHLENSRTKLMEWLESHWLVDANGWRNLVPVLRAVSNRFAVNANSLTIASEKIGVKYNTILDEISSQNSTIPAAVNQKLAAISLEARLHSIASKMLSRLSAHLRHLESLWTTEAVGIQNEMQKWESILAQKVGIEISSKTKTNVFESVESLASDPMHIFANRLISSIAIERLNDCWKINNSESGLSNSNIDLAYSFSSVEEQVLEYYRNNVEQSLANIGSASNVNPAELVNASLDSSSAIVGLPQTTIAPSANESPVDVPTATSVTVDQQRLAASPAIDSLRESGLIRSVASEIDSARPHLVEFGGAIHNVLVLPPSEANQLDGASIQQIRERQAAVIYQEGTSEGKIICIGEQLSLLDIINQLWFPTSETWQLAHRLLVRTDIDWLPIN